MAGLEKRLKAFLERNTYFGTFPNLPEVSGADRKSALQLLSLMNLVTPEDFILFFSACSLISASNKSSERPKRQSKTKHLQESADLDRGEHYYSFKRMVTVAIESAIARNLDFVKFCTLQDEQKQPLVYVKVAGLQFSYHFVAETPLMEMARKAHGPQYLEQDWEKVPIQRGAVKMFNYAMELENLTPITIDGSHQSPKDLIIRNRRLERTCSVLATASVQNVNKEKIKNDREQ